MRGAKGKSVNSVVSDFEGLIKTTYGGKFIVDQVIALIGEDKDKGLYQIRGYK